MKENIQNDLDEEARQHIWIWKWSSVGILSALAGIGAVLMTAGSAVSYPYGGEHPAVTFLGVLLVFAFSFCILTAPALIVRLIVRRPLPMGVGVILSILGLFTAFMIDAALGEKPSASLAMILVAGCAYKIACSLYGLRSIGIPITLPGDKKIGEEAPNIVKEPTPEKSAPTLNEVTDKGDTQEFDDIFDINVEDVKTNAPTSTVDEENKISSENDINAAPYSQSSAHDEPIEESAPLPPELERSETPTTETTKKGNSNIAVGVLAVMAVVAICAAMAHSAHQSDMRRSEGEKKAALQKKINARADFWNGVIEEDYAKVAKALEVGVEDINEIREEREFSYTALQYAVMKGNVEMVELLLRNGADVNKGTKSFQNLWYMFGSCKAGDYTMGKLITILSQAGLNPNVPIIVKLTPEQKQAFRASFEKDAKKIIKDASGEVFDAEEISKEMKPMLEEMLASGEMRTCILSFAVEKGLIDTVRVLLDCGANPNGVGEKTTAFNTPLYTASAAHRLDIVKLLVEHGANANWKDELTGTTPLLAAIGLPGKQSDRPLVRYLVEHGANCNQRNRAGLPFIHFAVANGDCEVVSLMISKGVSINTLAQTANYTPLRMALEYKQYACAKWLVDHGANLNIEDFEHLTDAMVIYFMGEDDPKWANLLTKTQKDKAIKDIIEWQRKYAHLYN